MEHHIKTLPQYWDAVKRGDKTFEVRKDDRGFQKGDVLVLEKMTESGAYYDTDYHGNKRVIRRRITYILTGGQFGIQPGYVVMGIQEAGNVAD